MLNLNSKTSYHVFDEYGMLIIPSNQSWEKRSWWKKLWDKILKREWVPTWTNKSWRDSVGRTVLAWIAYEGPDELEDALTKCVKYEAPNKKFNLLRHPNYKEYASRDHWSYFLIWLKMTDMHYGPLKMLMNYVPRMRGMNLWMKALTGNKRAEWLYYTLYIPGAYLGNAWLRICRWVMNFGNRLDEATNEWWIREFQTWNSGYCVTITNGLNLQRSLTKWQKIWAWIIFQTIPAYSLHNKAWQIFVMRESRRKERLKKILLKRVGKSNIMLRLLFGDTTVTQEEVNNYPHMTGYRPGVYLDETCRRDIREMTPEEAEFNSYELDLIKKLYNEK